MNIKYLLSFHTVYLQGILRVIASPTELKMQPTIHLKHKAGYGRNKYPTLPSQCTYCRLHFQFHRVHYH
jgi:hypothetical protein